MPDVDGYPEGTFASKSILRFREQLGLDHVQMEAMAPASPR